MGIFGAIVGAVAGSAFGGLPGSLLGSMIGSSLGDRMGGAAARTVASSAQQQQMVFAAAITSLAAKVAKADGTVTGDEVQAFDHFLKDSMRMSVEERKYAASIFNQARDSETPASEFATQLGRVFRGHRDRLRDVITILLMIALADGKLHPAEEALMKSIARDMGLSEGDYQSCKATFMSSAGVSDTNPYEVLGVQRSDSDADVRSAHRRLAREYHPDVLASKGLPEDFKEFASKKMAAINDAWSEIRAERGL